MKITPIKAFFSSLTIASAMFMIPSSTFATETNVVSPSIHVNESGDIKLTGAEVTSVTGNIINTVLRFKNTVTPVAITTNASTTIKAGSSTDALLTSIKVGDKLNISGFLTGLGTTFTITAQEIHDITSFVSMSGKSGIVQSVNVANNTFVIKTNNDKMITVQNNASTTFLLGNKATSTMAQAVTINAKVEVKGFLNTEGTILTATKVMVKDSEKNIWGKWKKHDNEDKKNKKDKNKNHDSNESRFDRNER